MTDIKVEQIQGPEMCPRVQVSFFRVTQCLSSPGTETELADTALDLLVLLLMEQWRWPVYREYAESSSSCLRDLIQR